MAKALVIVESPAKAKTINKYLGKQFVVKASLGHIKDLPKKDLAVDIEHGFEPRYEVIEGKRKLIAELKQASRKVENVYLAADPDREGEAICYHLQEELSDRKNGPHFFRVMFNEITKKAIEKAFEVPRQVNNNLVDAQQARRVLDRLVGYKISPPESTVNFLGYAAMNNKDYDKAAAFFKMNIENYQNSSNVYDSYADLLVAEKDTVNAIANYKKALALQDNAFTKQKLNALEGKESFTVSPEQLRKYAGVFDLDSIAMTITMLVKDNDLWAQVPGQGDFQLVPVSPDTFGVKNMSGYEVHFQMDGDKVLGFTSVQPNGTFKARVKK